jgi:hypothetical protein
MTLEPNATRSSNAGPGNAGLSLPTFFIYRSGPGATGDRWRGDTRVQPEGHGGVPKVIGACPAVGEAICSGTRARVRAARQTWVYVDVRTRLPLD